MVDLMQRRRKIREYLKNMDASVFLVLDLDNIRYLTGFRGSDAVLLIAGDEEDGDLFLCDSRYTTQAREEVKNCTVQQYQKKLGGIGNAARQFGAQGIVIEAQTITLAFFEKLRQALPDMCILPFDQNLESIRVLKDSFELEIIHKAVKVASESFREILERITAGLEERLIAVDLEYAMRRRGAQSASFDIIVASGDRSALPHWTAGKKTLFPGDLVVMDFGARVDGYCSDETCTLVVGRPSEEQKKVHGVVLEAKERAIEAIRPGVRLADIDAVARDTIHAAGYGKYFGHGLGHGVGINIHEEPRVAPNVEGIIEEGMVFTVEPGIYIPKWGGVRLEDMVTVTPEGCERMTFLPKTLISC